jgi:hypothetical protein
MAAKDVNKVNIHDIQRHIDPQDIDSWSPMEVSTVVRTIEENATLQWGGRISVWAGWVVWSDGSTSGI